MIEQVFVIRKACGGFRTPRPVPSRSPPGTGRQDGRTSREKCRTEGPPGYSTVTLLARLRG
jgi:hypothetical protein